MGVFTVETRVRNWQNRFLPPEEQGEEVTIEALVDTGAVGLCLPVEMIEQLRLIELDTIRVETADGSFHRYRVMGIAEVEVEGRSSRVAGNRTSTRCAPSPGSRTIGGDGLAHLSR